MSDSEHQRLLIEYTHGSNIFASRCRGILVASHLDYLEDNAGTESYDYDSAGKGGNRFATILLYFTDSDERDGGETVFSHAWPPDVAEEDRVQLEDGIAQLRASGDATMLKEGSWEEEMTALCRTRLSVRPHATRAVLFYSQVRRCLACWMAHRFVISLSLRLLE